MKGNGKGRAGEQRDGVVTEREGVVNERDGVVNEREGHGWWLPHVQGY
jgi:hypothetical protein